MLKTNICSFFILLLIGFTSCNIYEKEERLLAKHDLQNGDVVMIYYVDMGATTSEVIQVREKKKKGVDSILMNFKNNYLLESKLLNDSTLFLIVKDTGSINQDTSLIKLKK